MKLRTFLLAATIALWSPMAMASTLTIDLTPAKTNPSAPQMGDLLTFRTVLRNTGKKAVEGVIAWISLVQIDKGKEQPVDLEDWSAHKVVTASSLRSGEKIETDWPMRLIKAGRYRVVVSAVTRTGTTLNASPFADFVVRQKPVVESKRVLPIAFGLPLLIGAAMLWRRRKRIFVPNVLSAHK
jgi:hypothetical protein